MSLLSSHVQQPHFVKWKEFQKTKKIIFKTIKFLFLSPSTASEVQFQFEFGGILPILNEMIIFPAKFRT